MKNRLKTFGIAVLFVGLTGFAFAYLAMPTQTLACGGGGSSGGACGWGGSPGGGDYVPQRRGPSSGWLGSLFDRSNRGSAITKEQAHDILTNHVGRLNPSLRVGPVEDSGSFYKAEIFSEGKEVVDRLAVDKQSGRLMPVN